jgi:hypothetical protein
MERNFSMRIRFRPILFILPLVAIIAVWMPIAASAQGPAPAPDAWTPARTADGQPDVQGFWEAQIGGTYSLVNPRRGGGRLEELLREKRELPPIIKPSRIVDPPDGKIPYLPWAAAKQNDLLEHVDTPTKPAYVDPQARCLPDGVIRSTFWSAFQILQFPGYVVIVYEQNHPYRIIPLDGRPHIGQDVKLWMGDSRGHWEGNTLVVDVTSNNSKSRLDNEGDFATDAVHIVERYTFMHANTFQYEATIEDPSVYTRPWKIAALMIRAHRKEPGYELWEDACHEGEHNVEIQTSAVDSDTVLKK